MSREGLARKPDIQADHNHTTVNGYDLLGNDRVLIQKDPNKDPEEYVFFKLAADETPLFLPKEKFLNGDTSYPSRFGDTTLKTLVPAKDPKTEHTTRHIATSSLGEAADKMWETTRRTTTREELDNVREQIKQRAIRDSRRREQKKQTEDLREALGRYNKKKDAQFQQIIDLMQQLETRKYIHGDDTTDEEQKKLTSQIDTLWEELLSNTAPKKAEMYQTKYADALKDFQQAVPIHIARQETSQKQQKEAPELDIDSVIESRKKSAEQTKDMTTMHEVENEEVLDTQITIEQAVATIRLQYPDVKINNDGTYPDGLFGRNKKRIESLQARDSHFMELIHTIEQASAAPTTKEGKAVSDDFTWEIDIEKQSTQKTVEMDSYDKKAVEGNQAFEDIQTEYPDIKINADGSYPNGFFGKNRKKIEALLGSDTRFVQLTDTMRLAYDKDLLPRPEPVEEPVQETNISNKNLTQEINVFVKDLKISKSSTIEELDTLADQIEQYVHLLNEQMSSSRSKKESGRIEKLILKLNNQKEKAARLIHTKKGEHTVLENKQREAQYFSPEENKPAATPQKIKRPGRLKRALAVGAVLLGLSGGPQKERAVETKTHTPPDAGRSADKAQIEQYRPDQKTPDPTLRVAESDEVAAPRQSIEPAKQPSGPPPKRKKRPALQRFREAISLGTPPKMPENAFKPTPEKTDLNKKVEQKTILKYIKALDMPKPQIRELKKAFERRTLSEAEIMDRVPEGIDQTRALVKESSAERGKGKFQSAQTEEKRLQYAREILEDERILQEILDKHA